MNTASAYDQPSRLPKIRVAKGGHGFETEDGEPFNPFGVNYFRPRTGWAPQIWKAFDPDATRRDFERLRRHGATCIRVFLTFGSFYMKPGEIEPEGLDKFDRFLALADDAGIHVHPTGPDHWEGTPEWARGDRYANEAILQAQEEFWRIFAARYRNCPTIFAYDLLNEPSVAWDSSDMRSRWNAWIEKRYGSAAKAGEAWKLNPESLQWGEMPVPVVDANAIPNAAKVADYQRCREEVADEWTRRQAAAIKKAAPEALVTVGFIQWSFPMLEPGLKNYAAFRPKRQAKWLDFLEFHFYPLNRGAYQYRDDDQRDRNLADLECIARESASHGKPAVLAEFGWYGGGTFPMGDAKAAPATEEEQADWCASAVSATEGLATGWLNWGMFDTPEARDVSACTGLFTADGAEKAWGRRFAELAEHFDHRKFEAARLSPRPKGDWDAMMSDPAAAERYREEYYRAFKKDPRTAKLAE
jgi:hypothetical protein